MERAKIHKVKADLQILELTKAGSSLSLNIFANDKKLGTLEIGQGSLFWYPKNKRNGKRIDWTSFAEMMDKLAYGE